jgi:predicted O-methyltransferase YrrM
MFEFLRRLRNKLLGVNQIEVLINDHRSAIDAGLDRIRIAYEAERVHLESRQRADSEQLRFEFQQFKQLIPSLQEDELTNTQSLHTDLKRLEQLVRSTIPDQKYESFDVNYFARIDAALTSAKLFNKYLYDKEVFDSDLDLLKYCTQYISNTDLVLEFGVFSGRTVNCMAEQLPEARVFGFDSFEGLPETWRSDFTKGTFKTDEVPDVLPNVSLIKGWFDQTLPEFLCEQEGSVGLIHIDCDLYSSSKTVLDLLADHLKDGAILVFDEFFNYPGWEQHEYKAFQEFAQTHSFRFEYIGSNPRHQQVAVRVHRINN